eukprot:CAMPEP_0182476652 /NCGR_PEP_ID=MMETSP1319-20130603/29498_1 /TAXON_ID=172717 /ORGANISM="Bolidomonas pacifica, Strain RCC208" /LENGTH=43 /DNA_ID= /DNA_START= /DNA_END= /DNA_ORIENTATION=
MTATPSRVVEGDSMQGGADSVVDNNAETSCDTAAAADISSVIA